MSNASLNANGKVPSTEGRDPAYFSYYAMLQHQVVFKNLVPNASQRKTPGGFVKQRVLF